MTRLFEYVKNIQEVLKKVNTNITTTLRKNINKPKVEDN